MTWPLVGAQVKQRSWPLLPLFKSEQLHSIESKASRYAKVPIYTCTHVYTLHTFPLLICIPYKPQHHRVISKHINRSDQTLHIW